MGELKPPGKPFDISKWEVQDAWEKVKANKGAPGIDGVALAEFGKDLKGNLYKIWNRMSSGSYFPPPVKAVEIPKPHGSGTRILGVPTVADRIAQTVVAARLEKAVEPVFHPDSYGYRPGRSALDAVAACRKRCWKKDWLIDLDVEKFFDSVRWDLIVKAVEAHTDLPWVLLYVRRWLAAPLQLPDGTLLERDRGTPQGSSVSPVLANLFMHYAFDTWLTRNYPGVQFERYADDAVVHCATERQAREVLAAIGKRMEQVGLRLHPAKTRIVYCKDGDRRGSHEHTSFTFLGFTFRRPRGPRQEREEVHLVPARGQQGRPGQDECRGPPLAAAPAHLAHHGQPRPGDQSRSAGLDAVLRGVLPLRAAAPPAAHQRLPDALAPQEIQAAGIQEESPGLLGTRHCPVPAAVRPLGMGALFLVDRMTGAV